MAALPLPIASYAMQTATAGGTVLLNCYAQKSPDGGKSPVLLSRAAGITTFGTLDANAAAVGRGGCVMAGVLYVLVSNTLWRVSASGVGTSVGTIPGSERVKMATNGYVICIVRPADNSGYYCNGSATTQIVDSVFTGWGAADVAFIHRYFVFRRPNTGQFFNSALNYDGGQPFDALDIAEAESVPDDLLALTVDHEVEVLLFGTQSSEVWYDAVNEDGSPFSKSPGGVITLGVAGSNAFGSQDNSTFWLGNDKTVRRLAGVTPQKVSQFGIEAQLQKLTRVDDCYTVSWAQEGHMFIAFTFPFDGRTFVFDCSTQLWHERASLGYGAWRPTQIIECYGKQIVIDSRSGKIGYMDPAAKEEFGEPQRMSWTTVTVYGENKLAVHRRLELICNTGYGLLAGQGSDPLCTLEVSNDSGETWRTIPTKSLGLRGKYRSRTVWEKLGASRQRTYRFSVSDPIPVMAVAMGLDAAGGRW